jgi:uncharacterized membrane protein
VQKKIILSLPHHVYGIELMETYKIVILSFMAGYVVGVLVACLIWIHESESK